MNNNNLIQDAFRVLKRHLCKKGHYDNITMYLFSHDKLSEEDARSIIGLENWSNDNPNEVDVTTTLLHDVAGLFNDDSGLFLGVVPTRSFIERRLSMDNLKIGFYRTDKSKNAMHYPWLKRFNNDGTHVVNENPIEWEKKTIKEFFNHIKLGTFGRSFTIADFMKSYKPVLFSKGKKKVDIFHLEFLDQTVEQFLKIKEERDEKAEILSILQDQDWRAF